MTTVYAAMRDGLLVAEPDGDASAPGDGAGVPTVAETTEHLRGHALECVAVHPDRPERAFVGTFEDGLHRTTDGGETFERVGSEMIDPGETPDHAERRGVEPGSVSVMSAAVNPSDPDEVWAGTEPSALFRSTDGGDSWARVEGLTGVDSMPEWSFPPRPFTHHVRWLEVDPADPERVYVAVEAGALVVTPDAGATWIDRPPGSRRDNHSLATHPDAPGRVYSAAGDGYAESDDAGDTWDHPQSGLDHRYVWSVAVDPGEPDRVLVSSAHGAGRAHSASSADAHVYRSVGDRGSRAWERLGGRGLPTGEGVTRAVLAGGREAGEFYALANHGLYRTGDAGDAWEQVETEWPDRFESQTARGLAVVDERS